MTWTKVFLVVTIGALSGMLMGAGFGLAAGMIAPDLFSHLIPWTESEPRGTATVLGGIAGVLLGGGLAVFALVVQAFSRTRVGNASSST